MAGIPAAAAGSQSAALGLTPATLIVVFDVVLFLACAMAYVLGLAQRHPFQQAFARNRRIRNRTLHLTQRMGTRINGDYRAATDEPDIDREMAVRHAYFAAEDAYYQGMIEEVADPTFTEAVMRRRNRPPVRPTPMPDPMPTPDPAADPAPDNAPGAVPAPEPDPQPAGGAA